MSGSLTSCHDGSTVLGPVPLTQLLLCSVWGGELRGWCFMPMGQETFWARCPCSSLWFLKCCHSITPQSLKACALGDKAGYWLGLKQQENLGQAAVLVKEIGVKNYQGREEVNITYFLKSGKTEAYSTNPTGHNQQMPCYLQSKLHEKLIDYVFLELRNCLELASWGMISHSECAVWC